MSKRKSTTDLEEAVNAAAVLEDDVESSDDNVADNELLNVDFEFFDPQSQDFHGIRTLLKQLFDVDSTLFELSALTNLIIEQPLLGSTVKVDGSEGDPYAFLSILNLKQHKDKPFIQKIIEYSIEKSAFNRPLCGVLGNMLAGEPSHTIGLVLAERLLNMPVEVIPPMYNMLLEEITWAIEANEPYNFDYFLIPSKVYSEVVSKLDFEGARPIKRTKPQKKKMENKAECFYFHPEDETLEGKAGDLMIRYDFTNKGSPEAADSKRAFYDVGIEAQGELILISKENFAPAVKSMMDIFGASIKI